MKNKQNKMKRKATKSYIILLRSLRLGSPTTLPLRFSSFHGSYEYGISAPLQSKNDIDKMEPFRRNTEPPVKMIAPNTHPNNNSNNKK